MNRGYLGAGLEPVLGLSNLSEASASESFVDCEDGDPEVRIR